MNFEDFIENLYDDDAYSYSYHYRRNYLRDLENPIELYSNHNFRKRFRFSKDTVLHILIPLVSVPHARNSGPLPILLQLLTALRFYATGSFQIVCGDLQKISQSAVSKIVARLSKTIALNHAKFVKFPTEQEMEENKNIFFRKTKFPGVIGAIDCTHIPIKNPDRRNGEIYRNRKGWFSINVQLVCGPDLTIYDVVSRWPGSVHDSRIFSNSRCNLRFEEGDLVGKGILVGDSGYAQNTFLFTPILNAQTTAEQSYNQAHVLTRNVIERVNGVLKRRFACLNRKLQNSLPNTCNIIVACVVLHNVAIQTHEALIPQQLVRQVNPPVAITHDTVRGALVRSEFITRYF